MQFAMVPLNLFSKSMRADFVNTGNWSKRAISEAKRYGKGNIVASSEDRNFNYIPEIDRSKFDPEADFFHITSNTRFSARASAIFPDNGNVAARRGHVIIILSEPWTYRASVLFTPAAEESGLRLCIVKYAKI